jgi:hypothetical protein
MRAAARPVERAMHDLSIAYRNADFIPGGKDYPPLWVTKAAALRAVAGGETHSYGPTPREAFDLFRPAGEAQGTLVFVHGGYWMETDRSMWSHLAAGALARGWAVALPSYDLCPAVRIATITRQIAAAVDAVAALVPGPLRLAGHSAGGHLVARMACADAAPAAAARIRRIVPPRTAVRHGPAAASVAGRWAMAAGMRIMARRITSAAVPWIGALIAARGRKPAGALGVDLGRVDFPAEQGLHMAVGLRELDGFGHVGLDAGEALEIAVDEALRLGARDAQVAGQAKARDAVDHAEVDRLGLAADVGRHLVQRHVEHLGRGHGVDVDAVLERLLQRRDVGDMGQDAQFDLGIVQADQHLAGRATKASRMRRPSSVRTGMFCRFGSVEASRPVFAPAME